MDDFKPAGDMMILSGFFFSQKPAVPHFSEHLQSVFAVHVFIHKFLMHLRPGTAAQWLSSAHRSSVASVGQFAAANASR
jgi:hypothetical protein